MSNRCILGARYVVIRLGRKNVGPENGVVCGHLETRLDCFVDRCVVHRFVGQNRLLGGGRLGLFVHFADHHAAGRLDELVLAGS